MDYISQIAWSYTKACRDKGGKSRFLRGLDFSLESGCSFHLGPVFSLYGFASIQLLTSSNATRSFPEFSIFSVYRYTIWHHRISFNLNLAEPMGLSKFTFNNIAFLTYSSKNLFPTPVCYMYLCNKNWLQCHENLMRFLNENLDR